ncbi:AmmeMemoRadiSam system protein B [Candidatus Aerophobetes bacterium]|nr:AmmeMemoRadiSam system protein B [Candidatus Aerophobetes bacterium]
MLRKPAVAGTFYAGSRNSLKEQIEECFLHPVGPGKIPVVSKEGGGKIIGLISPHAGYIYSGPVAAWGFVRVLQEERPETVIILGPNHRGFGEPVAIMSQGEWETPLGKVSIDEEIARELMQTCSLIQEDEIAHKREHSLEVQVPFLQYGFNGEFKIVPLCLADQTFTTCVSLGEAISRVLKDKSNTLLIASTDLTHYQPQRIAEREDKKILDAILSGSPEELENVLSSGDFSMCGYGPVIALLEASSKSGQFRINLLKYATSGDITADYSAVVGYACLSIEK